jgi:hypothetical protein
LILGASVAIYRLLQTSAFEPADVERISSAYEQALIELRLVDRNDPLTEILAKLIVEVAQTGEKDSETICARALHQLTNPEREAC